MIEMALQSTARPGIPGRTYFVAVDLSVGIVHLDDRNPQTRTLRDQAAGRRLKALMAHDQRTLLWSSIRRQYAVALVLRESTGVSRFRDPMRALHDDEDIPVTHYRIIWFAETTKGGHDA